MSKSSSKYIWILLLVSALIVTTVSAVIYYFITAEMTIQAEISPVVFTQGEDTTTCGGDISANTSATFSSIPLGIGSNVTITELVNMTNTDGDDHTVPVLVDSEDFGTELKILILYLVAPNSAETVIVKIDDSGTVITENVSVNIPAGETWAIKLIGCYDAGTSGSQSNSINVNVRVEG